MNWKIHSSLRLRLAMVAAVGVVILLAYLDLRREQARALDDFIGEQAALAGSLAATLRARLELVSRDLQSVVDAEGRAARDAALQQIVGRDGAYLEVDVLDPTSAVVERALAAGVPAEQQALIAGARTRLLDRLAATSASSAGLTAQGSTASRVRLFGLRQGARTAVIAIDVVRLVSSLRAALRTPEVPVRLALIDESGVDIGLEVEGPVAAAAQRAASELASLRSEMLRGGDGASLVGRPAAEALGLGRRLAVAGYAPVPLGEGARWSLAIVTSASRVRDRARLTAWRLGITTALASLLVALFGGAVGRQQRREQQLAEALNLAEATAALRERSDKMIEVLPIGVLALDSRQLVVSANPYLMARGLRPGSQLRQALPGASADELTTLETLVAEARAAQAPKERIGVGLHIATGERRDIDAYAVPLGRPLSDVDCFLVLHDRTEIRSLERSLVRAEKLATIGTLAAGVAHEMGTPLGIISGRAEQLLARIPDGESGDPARKNVASILAQVDKVGTTIRQLLDFARVRPIRTEAVAPAQALGSAAALLEPHFRQAQVSLEVKSDETAPAVAADPGQLEQVLVNLLMNACDACTPSGHVWARARALGEHVAIEISDDGSGISREHLPMIMDPFFTTKKRGQGTGLGLTIAADIMKNHGGSLEVESVLGEGTTVRALLPRAPATEEQPA